MSATSTMRNSPTQLPGDDSDDHSRYLGATVGPLLVGCVALRRPGSTRSQLKERDAWVSQMSRNLNVQEAKAAFRHHSLSSKVSGAEMSDVTQILSAIEQGDPRASEQLLPLVYEELRRLAAQKMAQEAAGQTLQATALVHDAYIRLVDTEKVQQWNSRGHFFAAAAEAMRRILIERARGKAREKAGGDWQRINFEKLDIASDISPEQLVDLDDALSRLASLDPIAETLVKLRATSPAWVSTKPPQSRASRRQRPTDTGLTLGPGYTANSWAGPSRDNFPEFDEKNHHPASH